MKPDWQFGRFDLTIAPGPLELIQVRDVFTEPVGQAIVDQCRGMMDVYQVIHRFHKDSNIKHDGSTPGLARRTGIWPNKILRPEYVMANETMESAWQHIRHHDMLQPRDDLFSRSLRRTHRCLEKNKENMLWSYYGHGDGYEPHWDRSLITMIYYPPIPGPVQGHTGGDLIFPEQQHQVTIEPNMLVVFAGDRPHGVSPIECPDHPDTVLRLSITVFVWPDAEHINPLP